MIQIFGGAGINPPHIYMVAARGDSICVALGNGHLCQFDCLESLEGTRSWEAHNERVVCCGWEKHCNYVYTASSSDIAFWNETLVKRVALEFKVTFNQPNWIESSSSSMKVYVAGTDNKISILSFRG